MENKKILIYLFIITLIGLVSAFDPQSNITMRNLYSINNGVIANFTTYFGDGSQLTGISGSGGNSSFNQTLTDSLYADISIIGDNSSWNQSLADTLYSTIGAGGNTSWNESLANTLYADIIWGYNQTEAVNPNSTQMSYSNGNLNILESWLDIVTAALGYIKNLATFDTDDLSEGSTNKYEDGITFNSTYDNKVTDNETWNQTGADLLYADISVTGDNESWNQTLADILYRENSWDNFTGIPTATPSNGDVTHFSLADQIYDWAIGLFISTELDPAWTSNYSDRTGTGNVVFHISPTFETGITVPANSISDDEINESDTFEWTAVHSWTAAVDFSGDVEFNDEIRPDNVLCDNGDILYKTGADNWDCKTVIEAGAGDMNDLQDDTSPQLGGYLDTAGENIGSTTDEIENIYMGTNVRLWFGNGQEASIYFNGSGIVIGGS